MTPNISYMAMSPAAPAAEPGMFLFSDGFGSTMSWNGQPGGIYRWMGGNEFIYTFPSPSSNNSLQAMTIGDDGTVYVAGTFTTVSGNGLNRVARWDSATSSWVQLNGGLDGNVYEMQVIDGKLYVCGAGLKTATVDGQSPQIVYTAGVAIWNIATGLWEPFTWPHPYTSTNTITTNVQKYGSTLFLLGNMVTPASNPSGFPVGAVDLAYPNLNLYIPPGLDSVVGQRQGRVLQIYNDGSAVLMTSLSTDNTGAKSMFYKGTVFEDSGQYGFLFDPDKNSSPSNSSLLGNGMGVFSSVGDASDWVGVRTARYGMVLDSSSRSTALFLLYSTNGVNFSHRRYSTQSKGWYVDMGSGHRIYHATFNTITGYPWTIVSYDYNELKTTTSYPTETAEVTTYGVNGLRVGSHYFPDYNALDI